MTDENSVRNVEGVSLREYIELLVQSQTNEIKVIMAERLQAVQTAYEQHQGEHEVISNEMEHLNKLRQDVIQDRGELTPLTTFNTFDRAVRDWMGLMGSQISSLRGQIIGAGAVLTIVFATIQIAIALYQK